MKPPVKQGVTYLDKVRLHNRLEARVYVLKHVIAGLQQDLALPVAPYLSEMPEDEFEAGAGVEGDLVDGSSEQRARAETKELLRHLTKLLTRAEARNAVR